MPPIPRYELLPHVDALIALARQSGSAELAVREIIELVILRSPVNLEAHLIQPVDHAQAIELLGKGLMNHVTTGWTTRSAADKRGVIRATVAHRRELDEHVALMRRLGEMHALVR